LSYLVVVDPEAGEREVALTEDEYVIGRDPGADLQLPSAKVSRRHARLYVEGDTWWLEDLGSANGTFVGGQRVSEPVQMAPGVEVRISSFGLSVYAEAADEEDAESAAPVAALILVGLTPPCLDERFLLGPDSVDVGRASECGIVVADASVSRHHAKLELEGDALAVQDLSSSNGTYINDQRIERQLALVGQRVRFGDVVFELRLAESPGAGLRLRLRLGVLAALAVLIVALGTAVVVVARGHSASRALAERLSAYESTVRSDLVLADSLVAREAWDEAEATYRHVLDVDPINPQARTGNDLARRSREHKALIASARQSLERSDASGALRDLSRVDAKSFYANTAAQLREQAQATLAAHSIEQGRSACRHEDWRGCHAQAASALAIMPSSVAALALIAQAEERLRQSNAEFAPWVGSDGHRIESLAAFYPDPATRAAALKYAGGDLDEALRTVPGTTSKLAEAIGEYRRSMEAGTAAARKQDQERAIASFEKAISIDREAFPAGFPSLPRADAERTLLELFVRLGEVAMNRGGWAEAFSWWQRGLSRLPGNAELLAGVTRLEGRAAGILSELQKGTLTTSDCARIDEILSTTADSSSTHRAAAARRRECGAH
jgi:pSer/pThr/pTyr-binding forkhead associated (FHA) protein